MILSQEANLDKEAIGFTAVPLEIRPILVSTHTGSSGKLEMVNDRILPPRHRTQPDFSCLIIAGMLDRQQRWEEAVAAFRKTTELNAIALVLTQDWAEFGENWAS